MNNTIKVDSLRLDKLNNERYIESLADVKKAIRILDGCHIHLKRVYEMKNLNEYKHEPSIDKRIAKVINILSNVSEKMNWHCEHFGYDIQVCMDIDDVIGKLAVAIAYNEPVESMDVISSFSSTTDALNLLGKVLGTLVMWDNEDEEEAE